VVVLPLVVLLVLGPAVGGELAHPAKSIIAANIPSFVTILSSKSARLTIGAPINMHAAIFILP
jgi:hypothetical protein